MVMVTAEEAISHQYDNVCRPKLDSMEQKLCDIHSFIFIGNGKESFSVRVASNTQTCRVLIWMNGVFLVALITGFVGLVFTR